MTTALNILGTAARTNRQLQDFGDRLSCKEIQDLRDEAAALDWPLPRYLHAVVQHRRADLIRETMAAEAALGPEV